MVVFTKQEYPAAWDELETYCVCGLKIPEDTGYLKDHRWVCVNCAQESLNEGDTWIEAEVNNSLSGMIGKLEAVL